MLGASVAISRGHLKPCDVSSDQPESLLPLFWFIVCMFALFMYHQIPPALGACTGEELANPTGGFSG